MMISAEGEGEEFEREAMKDFRIIIHMVMLSTVLNAHLEFRWKIVIQIWNSYKFQVINVTIKAIGGMDMITCRENKKRRDPGINCREVVMMLM